MNKELKDAIIKDLFELSSLEDDRFRKGAYYRAALNFKQSNEDNYLKIKGIGKSIAIKIKERIETGKISKLEQYRKENQLNKKDNKYLTLDEATKIVDILFKDATMKFDVCGSYKRKKANVSDIDVLVLKSDIKQWKEYFKKFDTFKIKTNGNVSFDFYYNDVLVNIRSTEKDGWGAGLLYLVGPQPFSIYMRALAHTFGYKLNQYGLFKGDKKIAGETEDEIFKKLGIDFISAEERS